MSTAWWRSDLNPEGLSQGDLIRALPFALSVVPPKRLQVGTGKGGVEIWTVTPDTKRRHFLFEGQEALAVVVSHSCDIEKKERKGRVLVAPVQTLASVSPGVQSSILAQERISLMPLPDVPGLGNYYADLRLICATSRALLEDDRRVASMSDEGVERTQVQLAKFFTRLVLP